MTTTSVETESGIDFDQTLRGPDGKPIREVEKADGARIELRDVTLGALCYAALMKPSKPGEPAASMDAVLKVAKVAVEVAKGGKQSLTVPQIKMICDRLVDFPPAYVFAAISVLDPARLEKA